MSYPVMDAFPVPSIVACRCGAHKESLPPVPGALTGCADCRAAMHGAIADLRARLDAASDFIADIPGVLSGKTDVSEPWKGGTPEMHAALDALRRARK